MINKPVTESHKTASVSVPATTVITAAAKPSEQPTMAIETTATASTANAAPQYVASGIELNVPVEKIEAEKKSTASVSQPTSTPAAAAASEVRESSSSQQSSAKKDKKDKKRKFVRMAAGTVWEDQTLGDWDLGEQLAIFTA